MDGLYPMFIDPNSGLLLQSTVTLGARGDSLYEYLLKQFLLAGNRRHEKCGLWALRGLPCLVAFFLSDNIASHLGRMWLLDMYSKSVKGILSKLLQVWRCVGPCVVVSPLVRRCLLRVSISIPRRQDMPMSRSRPKQPHLTMTCRRLCVTKWTI
jgi:hypothetical protein